MSIKSFQKLIKEIVEYVLANGDNDYIVIGENTSGKSALLSCLMERVKKIGQNKFYFIDSVNRSFHLNNIGDSKEVQEFEYEEICNRRLEKNIFNKIDSFGTGGIESIYWIHEKKLKELIFDFFEIKIDISVNLQDDIPVVMPAKLEIEKNGRSFSEEGYDLSIPNGMQAVIRLFLELLFFRSQLHNEDSHQKPIVFIEELDLYLSENYSAQIFEFLKEKFPEFLFIISTHSRDLAISAVNTTVIAIKDLEMIIVNIGENYQLDVEELFADIFHTTEMKLRTNDDETDRKIRVLLNKKLNNNWYEADQNMYDQISKQKLLPHQIYLMDEIKRWKYE